MAYMPDLNPDQKQTFLTYQFKGYNHHPVIADGEMYEQVNISGDMYPLLTQRERRTRIPLDEEYEGDIIDALWTKYGNSEGFVTILETNRSGMKLMFISPNDTNTTRLSPICYELCDIYDSWSYGSGDLGKESKPKCLVQMGVYIYVFPTCLRYNLLTDEATYFRNYKFGTNSDSGIYFSDENGNIDQNGNYTLLKFYLYDDYKTMMDLYHEGDEIICNFSNILNMYNEHASDTMTAEIMRMDGLKHTILKKWYDEDQGIQNIVINWKIDKTKLDYKEYITGEHNLGSCRNTFGGNYEEGAPTLLKVVEHGNRLWGYIYNEYATTGSVNEIRASALGDGTKWDLFEGTNADSWAASVGTIGDFTGVCSYSGGVVYMKRNRIFHVTGTNPSSFGYNEIACDGCIDEDGIAVAGNLLYYASSTGVMSYDGSLPSYVSRNMQTYLRENNITTVKLAVHGKKLFVMYKRVAYNPYDNSDIFVYDTESQMWHKYDSAIEAVRFVNGIAPTKHGVGIIIKRNGNDIIEITDQDKMVDALKAAFPTQTDYYEDKLEWEAVFGMSGYEFSDDPYNISRYNLYKQGYISRYNIRMKMEKGSKMNIWIEYDSDGEWHNEGEVRGMSMGTVMIPVIPRRCDHCRLKLTGTGRVEIYSIARLYEVGEDGGL